MNRRELLRTTALVPLVAVLASCASSGGSTLPQEVLDEVAAVVNGFANALPELEAISGMSTGVIAQIGGWITQAQTDLTTLSSGISLVLATPTIEDIVSLAGQIIAVLPVGLLPPGVSVVVVAIQVLLPVILAAIGQSSSETMRAKAAMMRMTPQQALVVLQQFNRSH